MVRGDNLYASGIVLVTPLELEVLEEPESGRVRVPVRDAETKDLVPKVQVKVIGSDNPSFLSGETDLRGVFVAEGVRGPGHGRRPQGDRRSTPSTAAPPTSAPPSRPGPPPPNEAAKAGEHAQEGQNAQGWGESLDKNLKDLNISNQMRQIERLENRYRNEATTPGKPGGAAAGGFK